MKLFLLLLALSHAASAATIELLAGGGSKTADAPATECALIEPFGAEFLPDGTMIIVEMVKGNRVLQVDSAGRLTVIAGTGVKGFAGDGGSPREAQFNGIHNLAISRAGDIFLSDSWNYRIRKIAAGGGTISSIAGTGLKAFSGDGGPAREAAFSTIIQIALTPDDSALFAADIENRRIRKITLATGIVETIAGNGARGVPVNGEPAVSQPLVDPRAVIAAPGGGIYILERNGNALRHVDAEGRIRTVAGTGKQGYSGDDGPAIEATFNGPKHLCMDRDGSVLIADAENHVIRRYDPRSGFITRIAGTGRKGAAGLGGDPLACELNRPHGVTIAPDGALIITDSYNDRLLRIRGR